MTPLKPLHSSLIESKLTVFYGMTTDDVKESLVPGQSYCLKARPDGTMLDGHHRVHVLRSRGVDVDSLPREIVRKTVSDI